MEAAKNLPFPLNLLGEKTNCALYSGSLRRILQALRCESEKLLSTTIETFCLSGSPLKDGDIERHSLSAQDWRNLSLVRQTNGLQ